MINTIELIDLSNWKNQKDIILEFHREYGINLSPREWRKAVEKWNHKFFNGEADFYITHSNSKGYKATVDYAEAKEARNDYIKRATNMYKKAKECDIAFRNLKNYKIDFKTGGLK